MAAAPPTRIPFKLNDIQMIRPLIEWFTCVSLLLLIDSAPWSPFFSPPLDHLSQPTTTRENPSNSVTSQQWAIEDQPNRVLIHQLHRSIWMSGAHSNERQCSCVIDSRSVAKAQTSNASGGSPALGNKNAHGRPVGVRSDCCDLDAQLSLSRLTHEDDRHVFLQHILTQLQQVSKRRNMDRNVRRACFTASGSFACCSSSHFDPAARLHAPWSCAIGALHGQSPGALIHATCVTTIFPLSSFDTEPTLIVCRLSVLQSCADSGCQRVSQSEQPQLIRVRRHPR